MLKDLWPTQQEVSDLIASSIKPEMFKKSYGNVFDGNPQWNAIPVAGGDLYQWNETSTYIQHPPFFERDDAGRAVDQAVEQPARAGDLRRFGHDRSHFSGGQHRGEQPGGTVSRFRWA